MARPDYITCIRHTRAGAASLSWCGRRLPVLEFAFTHIDHAAYSQINEDRLVVCPECRRAVVTALETQKDDE